MCSFILLKRLPGIARKLQGFQTHYPARGRKPSSGKRNVANVSTSSFKSITPQGDGNVRERRMKIEEGTGKDGRWKNEEIKKESKIFCNNIELNS